MEYMKAAVFKGNGVLNIEEIRVPMIKKATEVKIMVIAASICGSDLHALSVPPVQKISSDIVLGHEFFGKIVEKGTAITDFSVGDKVAIHPSIACGHCYECTHNMPDLCANRAQYGQTMDGGFAQYVVVESSQLYKLPDNVNPDRAAQTEPLSCIVDSLHKVRIRPEDNVILFGAGPIGLTFIRTLKYMGVRHLAVSAKGDVRIREAKESGADIVVDVERENIGEVVKNRWEHKANVIIDAVGSGEILTEAMELLGSRGQVLVFGYNQLAEATVRPGLICGKEFTIVGAIGKDFEGALQIVNDPKLGLEKLVTRRIVLDELHEAIDDLRAKKACRIIVYPNGREELLLHR